MTLWWLNLVGFMGTFLLAFCALPLCFQALRDKEISVSPTFLYFWFIGEVFLLAYVLLALDANLILMLNYGLNIICLLPVIYYNRIPIGKNVTEISKNQTNTPEGE